MVVGRVVEESKEICFFFFFFFGFCLVFSSRLGVFWREKQKGFFFDFFGLMKSKAISLN